MALEMHRDFAVLVSIPNQNVHIPEADFLPRYVCHCRYTECRNCIDGVFLDLNHFSGQPQNSTVTVGETAHFRCHINGVPRPTIEWQKNEAPLQLSDR